MEQLDIIVKAGFEFSSSTCSRHFHALSLSFLIWKMGIITTLTSQCYQWNLGLPTPSLSLAHFTSWLCAIKGDVEGGQGLCRWSSLPTLSSGAGLPDKEAVGAWS